MSLELDKLAVYRHQACLLTVDISIAPGEVVTVMGASGAGKSTLLDVIIGQIAPPFSYTGSIRLAGRRLNDVATHQRNIGMLYQDALLFEHLSVGDNIAFALPRERQQALGKAERRAEIMQQLDSVGLAAFYDRPVHTLSGGQQARIALLRTLASRPKAVLLDEPFGKLDAARKQQLREWVFTQLHEQSVPVLMVTHDKDDADAAGGRIIEV